MTEDTAWRVTGFVLRVSSLFCWLVSITTGDTRVRNCVVHVFPVVSELGYLLLEHVVINDLEFCLWEMSRQGGS